MTDTDTSPNGDSIEAPEPIVEKGRGFSLIWVIPIVAVIVGAVVGIDAIRNRGTEFVITFPTAEWIEAGKTKIKFLDIDVGTVDTIEVKETADGVELHCTVNQQAAKRLRVGAMFGVFHRWFGLGGVTGLGRILWGAYLVLELGPVDAK
jgi:paraquat-inducible protein B